MKSLNITPSLTEQVYHAIMDEIIEGRLETGAHLVQEQLASTLGVSRQPVQQALALLRADGVLKAVGRRGLCVAGLDLHRMRGHYEIRRLLDGYAARQATEAVSTGAVDAAAMADRARGIFAASQIAIREQLVRDQIRCDEAFHTLIYEMSGNPVIAETAELNWRYLRRVMADVLRHAEPVTEIWEQHQAIWDAVLDGDPSATSALAENHVRLAADELFAALDEKTGAASRRVAVA